MAIMVANKTQKQCVREYLEKGRSITALQALGMFSVYRLAAVIHALKKDGFKTWSLREKDANGKSFARYKMLTKPNS